MATRMTGGTFFCVPNSVITHLSLLSGAATKVYFVLRAHMNQATGEAFPSYNQIMEIAGLQRESVARAVKELVAAELLTVRKQGRRSFYQFDNRTSSKTEPVRKPNHTSSIIELKTVRKPNSNKTKVNKTNLTRADADASDYSAPFESFWIAYGRRGSKQTAWREWRKHVKGGMAAAIMAAIPVYLATERVAVRGFKLDAERFISRHVWENPTMGEENDAPARASPSNGHANGRASPADKQERTRGNLVEWFVESEGISEQVDVRQANGAVGKPLRARTHEGPH